MTPTLKALILAISILSYASYEAFEYLLWATRAFAPVYCIVSAYDIDGEPCEEEE